ncbi:uncharacterized protein LOC130893016 [Diorhabda carinulata]|uniref:uncharacterized protein LOC130893016 n=1 Tax=Diorhabda carinulata TaxID=1163345 RepID=UPI0025A15470|nr:uncharacterized protein LOC130893016 [Diorhabda carinulata]
MSSFKTITERPQASRIDRPKSCAEETSVSPMDSGGDKKPTSKSSRNTKIFKIITYNVRTLSSSSKLLEMEEEIKDISWDIIGLCETRRKEEQLLKLKSGHLFYQNENPNSPDGGIGFLINKRLEKSIVTLKTISDRVAYITLSISKRYEIKIIQVYAPTTPHTDEEVDIFYGDIEIALKENRCYYTFIMGDFNAKIGKQTDMSEVAIGSFGIDGRNERGQTLIDFLHNQKLYVMNSFFQKKLHIQWTWVNPNGRTKNEIDFFITTRKRFVTDVTVLNKFGIGSDHRAVRATVRINARNERQKMIRKKQQIKRLADGKKEIIKLKDNNKKETNNRRELVKIVEEFYKELYRSRREELNITENKMKVVNQGSELVPEITIEESKNALTEMKNKKAAGEDQIVIEAVKVGGEKLLKEIISLFNLCLQKGEIPEKWRNATIILIHKKGDITNLENYRPISLLSHLYKWFTKIVTKRLERKLDFYQPREQAGFRIGYGTNDHLQTIKILIEKSIEYNRPLVMIFVDFKKAFDTVELPAILSALQQCRIDYRYAKLIKHIYENATLNVNLHEPTNKIHVGRGIRQGDTISPKLFTCVLEYSFKKLNWEEKGINIDVEAIPADVEFNQYYKNGKASEPEGIQEEFVN